MALHPRLFFCSSFNLAWVLRKNAIKIAKYEFIVSATSDEIQPPDLTLTIWDMGKKVKEARPWVATWFSTRSHRLLFKRYLVPCLSWLDHPILAARNEDSWVPINYCYSIHHLNYNLSGQEQCNGSFGHCLRFFEQYRMITDIEIFSIVNHFWKQEQVIAKPKGTSWCELLIRNPNETDKALFLPIFFSRHRYPYTETTLWFCLFKTWTSLFSCRYLLIIQ